MRIEAVVMTMKMEMAIVLSMVIPVMSILVMEKKDKTNGNQPAMVIKM